jgi:hypothetical protein
MGLNKNVASQKIGVYAYDTAADGPKTGDAANITAQISKDFGAAAATNDTNPTELDATDHPGVYVFDLTQAETDADNVLLSAVSATGDIVLDPIQVFTVPPNFRALGIESDGDLTQVNTLDGHTPQTGDSFARLINLGITTGAVQTNGGNSATAFETDLAETANDHWNESFLLITSGALAGQVRRVSDYDGTSKVITVTPGFSGTPADSVTFALVNR